MRRLVFTICCLILLDLLLQQCANPASPTGGPKDTIPPTLTESYPINGTTNFQEQEIILEFSEYVNADKLKQKLIITPKTDVNYKSIVRKNKLIIRFDEPFEDSTTFNLNFSDAVTDITEKNPAVNLSLAFSTGSYIDSMSIRGTIIDLFEQEPVKGYTVGLYPFSDTLDYFKQFPVYFTTTNDSGNFKINYIKTGNYKVLAFEDDNNNVLFDPESEAHGFIADTIRLDSGIILYSPIPTLLQNIKPIAFINSRPSGAYVEAKFNKTIHTYSITPDTFPNNLVGENKDAIRFYKPIHINYKDSTEIIVTAKDSLNNLTTDTLKLVFLESNRKPSDLDFNIKAQSTFLTDKQKFEISFNKPIKDLDTSKLVFNKDTSFLYIPTFSYSWNFNKTILLIETDLNKDSLLFAYQQSLPADTTLNDSISTTKPPVDNQLKSIDFTAQPNAFVSIEDDSTKTKNISVPFNESTSFGTIKFSLTTDHEKFTLQLLDRSGKVHYQHKDEKIFTFPKIKPSNYIIRVLIDADNNGVWSPGNLLLNKEPEPIYLHPEETSVRENWVLEISLSF